MKNGILDNEEKKYLEELLYNKFYDKEKRTIILRGLDFTRFNCNVDISYMKVEGNLKQHGQVVGGELDQYCQEVGKDLHQFEQVVGGDLFQYDQEVKGEIYE